MESVDPYCMLCLNCIVQVTALKIFYGVSRPQSPFSDSLFLVVAVSTLFISGGVDFGLNYV